jgi:TonB family protein
MTRSIAAVLLVVAVAAHAAEPTAPAAAPAPPAVMSDGMAVAIERPPPKFPPAAAKKGIDGCVVVSFLVDAQGKAAAFEVVEAQPKGVFEDETLAAVKHWRFAPPARPGRYAQAVQYQIKDRAKQVNTCQPVPSFAALNPDAPPLMREVQLLNRVMPAFAARGDAVDGGCVTVRFQIRHDGFVGDVQVLEARPPSLAEPAVAAVKQWNFRSFPPPDVYVTQTFYYQPDLVKLPDNVVRGSFAELNEAQIQNVRCGARRAPKDKAQGKAGSPG